jgi:type IV pilus assembly protein PilP
MKRLYRFSAMVGVLVAVAGCGTEQEELTQWLRQQDRDVRTNVIPLTPPKKFNPQPYTASTGADPFSSQKLSVAIKTESRSTNSLLAAESNRRKEPLESFALEGMVMVGSVLKGPQPFALVRVENLLYSIKVGDYMGQNFGKVTRVTETEIGLREIAQDASGEWVERATALQLQEKAR